MNRQDFPSLPRRSEDRPKRHEGAYYGEALREHLKRSLSPEPTEPSLIDLMATWWMARHWPAVFVVFIVIAAIVAAVVVNI